MKQIILDLQKQIPSIEITENCEIFGVFIGKKDETLENILNIWHKVPNITSRILVKVVLYDNSHFRLLENLKIVKGAKGTDSFMKMDVLLIGKGASAKVIPGMEITENAVIAGHSATFGKINSDQLFYLMSKGISKEQSEKLIVDGFLNDIYLKIKFNKEG